jgi:hypothetical protein
MLRSFFFCFLLFAAGVQGKELKIVTCSEIWRLAFLCLFLLTMLGTTCVKSLLSISSSTMLSSSCQKKKNAIKLINTKSDKSQISHAT